jgi:hypothetical protein
MDLSIYNTNFTLCSHNCDFSPIHRDTIKQWLKDKFGEQNCVSIGTYGTLGVKTALQDLCRVLMIKPFEYFPITKEIAAEDKDLEIEEIEEKYPKIKLFFKKYPEIKENVLILVDMKRSIGCIAEGSKLLSGIKIENAKSSKFVNYLNNKGEIKNTSKFKLIDSGFKKCIKLEFNDNSFLECTEDHLIFTKNRGLVEAKNLSEEDEIICLQ